MIQKKTITSIFSSIVQSFPEKKAVIHNNDFITYRDVDAIADRLACQLNHALQIKGGMIIAIYLPSSIEAIISMLGILKAGHAYLPMDINDPLSRTKTIIQQSQPNIIITSSVHKDRFKSQNFEVWIADNLFADYFADIPDLSDNILEKHCTNIDLLSKKEKMIFPDSLAYIIYTSGSTGKPKGIPIKHQAVLNLLEDFQQRCPLDNNDRCSLWTNLNFDVSVYEIWSTLLFGATLFIPDQQIRLDIDKFIQWLKTNAITSAYIPPFMVAPLTANSTQKKFPLKRILTGVEPIPETLLCDLKRNTPGLCLINGYGPAEATVCATLYEVPDYPDNPGNAPIGKPVNNLKIYILDDAGKPVKDGKQGEIHIAGIQVADGYLNEATLSVKSFLENPFSKGLPGFMYKTGDRGTRLKTGDIMFGGRKDFQIKLRGFRIEPGEIENVINEFPGISQSAVILKNRHGRNMGFVSAATNNETPLITAPYAEFQEKNKSQRQILTAYVDSNPDKGQLISFLKMRLPQYMLPSAIIFIEKMPLTSQGKIDKKNLLEREDLQILDKDLPQTKEEKKIAEIWESVLKISPIYRTDDYFLLGGDSISGVKILSRLNSFFSTDIDMRTLFEHSLLKDIAKLLKKHKHEKINTNILKNYLSNEIRVNKNEFTPLCDDQNLIWLFERINPGTAMYHIPLIYKITGLINHESLKQSIEIIKNRHIALKSQFFLQNDIVFQKQEESGDELNKNTFNGNEGYQKFIHYKIAHINDYLNENRDKYRNFEINDVENRWILEKTKAKFNLETGPLFRTDFLITGESTGVLCFTFHHIIFDGWSAGLFIQELIKTYGSLVKGETPKLLETKLSYHDYVSARIFEAEHAWTTAKPFFTSYLKNLPKNYNSSSPGLADFSGACFPVNIDTEIYNKIKTLALESKTTSFTILFALFQILLCAETGQEDQITGIAYAGRDTVDTESIIGFLMNTLVVRTVVQTDHDFKFYLGNVKRNLEEIFRYKNIPFQRINNLCQEMSQRKKVFESMFLMQTMEFPLLDLQGVEAKYVHPDMGKANCDITLELFENESGVNGWFEYRTDTFNEKKIKQMTTHFNQIIKNAVDQPETKINTLLHMHHYPISAMQHGMLMETLRSPQGAGSYIEQIMITINQEIDLKRFTKAWQKIINHHEVLRLGFVWKNLDQPLQYVEPVDELNITLEDWTKISKPETDEFIDMFLKADRRLGFSLSEPPVFRIALLKTDENQYICVWSFHHLLADGRSMVAILKDLFSIYDNPEIKLTPTGSFKDYIVWLNREKINSEAKEFWNKQLKSFTEPLNFPLSIKQRAVAENRRQKYSVSITTGNQKKLIASDKTSVLQNICKQNSITMNSLLMGVWAVLLSHYTGKNDIVFGATRSVRNWKKNGNNDTGLYINTLPVRIKIDPQEKFSTFLSRIRNEWIKTKDFEYSSLSDIHAWSQVKGGSPLFNIFFAYDYHYIDTALEGYKEKISCSRVSLLERTPASLFLTVFGVDELAVTLEYDQRQFDAATIKQVLSHFSTLLESMDEQSDPRLMDISILTSREKNQIAEILNTNKIFVRPDSCIHHLIDIQASLNKEAIAVTDHGNSLTYSELNIYANQIANFLIKLGTRPETKVMLLLEQSVDLIAVILGVLKSGGAYIPLDKDYPDERINYIIEDATPEVIITSTIHEHRLNTENAKITLLDKEMAEIKKMDASNPKIDVTPENMAYIIYTSGSTGKPKGVIVEHSDLAAFTRSASEIYDIQADDRVLQFASISFDASAEEIFPTLFSGGTLVIKPREVVQTPSQFFDFCRDSKITVLDLPTSYWHMIADEIDTLIIPEYIRLIIIGGDEANFAKVKKWNQYVNGKIRLINTYGPTETTVAVTWEDLSSGSGVDSVEGKVSIGKPFPNINLCILNQFQQPALPGTMGELYIGGTQTARGYLNRKELTSKSFVKVKNLDTDITFFKTGDNVKMLPQNGILFYGRIDRQIKIRGFRVEPGEIEKTALLHNSVSECAVAVSKDSDNNIIIAAFFVPVSKDKANFSINELRAWLLSKLPSYMVPSLLLTADVLPYTASGKIDYNALEIPKLSKASVESTAINSFNNPYEKELKIIWENILNYEICGSNDSFFDIGGSSLYAIKLVNAIEKKFKVAIPVIAVFKSSTISKLAKIIEKEIQLSQLNTRRLISKKGTQTPIILVGNSVGAAQTYKKANLKGHPFYHAPIFIHFYSAEEKMALSLDIWQLAQKCINDILHFFPSGPYIIMGECLNSIVAHEVACQLVNMHQEVELLVILDDNWDKKEPPSIDKAHSQVLPLFLKQQIHEMNKIGVMHMVSKMKLRAKQKIRSYYTSMDSIKEQMYNKIGRSIPEAIQFRLMENVFYKACAANPYMPLPYYGRVLLFYSNNWVEEYSPQLKSYYKGIIKQIDVNTTHSEWFKPEQIKTIINEIEKNCK